jgi:hypothetical protein
MKNATPAALGVAFFHAFFFVKCATGLRIDSGELKLNSGAYLGP